MITNVSATPRNPADDRPRIDAARQAAATVNDAPRQELLEQIHAARAHASRRYLHAANELIAEFHNILAATELIHQINPYTSPNHPVTDFFRTRLSIPALPAELSPLHTSANQTANGMEYVQGGYTADNSFAPYVRHRAFKLEASLRQTHSPAAFMPYKG